MSCSTSSPVSPTATQPGTSGEYAPYEFSPFSMMTKILAISILFLYFGLFKDTEQCSNRHILSRMPRERPLLFLSLPDAYNVYDLHVPAQDTIHQLLYV